MHSHLKGNIASCTANTKLTMPSIYIHFAERAFNTLPKYVAEPFSVKYYTDTQYDDRSVKFTTPPRLHGENVLAT